MKKILAILAILILVGGYFVGQKKDTTKVPAPKPVYVNTFSIPKTLEIPKLKLKANVEEVGMDSVGRMDVPKKVEDAAWYKLGAKPGDQGSAVLDGHLDTAAGTPAVFYYLKNLSPGDLIYITDTKGKKLTYQVEKLAYYDYNKFPLQLVFADTSEKRLNLITCIGVWDASNKNYSQRLVVFSKLKE